MRKVLVVGFSGQLAQALIDRSGDDIIALGRGNLDLSDPASIEDAIAQVKPTGVINAAAYTAVDKAENELEAAFALNRDGPAALARACARLGAPLVHVSTDYVFDGTKAEPYLETDPKAPLGVYGRSKSEGEDAVLAACERACVIRTSWVYSAAGANFVKTMLRLAAGGRDEVGVVADQIGRPTYAPDLAEACLTALGALSEGAGGGVYHYAGAGDATWADLAESVFDLARELGLPSAAVKRITTAEFPTPAKRPANSRLDTRRIEVEVGARTHAWRESLRRCVTQLAAGA